LKNYRVAVALLIGVALAATLSAQGAPPAEAKGVTYDATIKTDEEAYTGTIQLLVHAGKVTGTMLVTGSDQVTGTVAGTEKSGVLSLEFPFHMKENACDGKVKMNITMPDKPGPATGTLEAVGCGREEADKVTGTVELKPAAPKGAPAGRH
jgi:hypothetical protein